jgi:hypothetical protein
MNNTCEICERELKIYQKKFCSRACNGKANNRAGIKRRVGLTLANFAQAYINTHPAEAEIIQNFMWEWEKVSG